MRYFTKELWMNINDCDTGIRAKAEKEWSENQVIYQQQFAELKKRLPRRFVKEYLSRNGLHDYTILGITINRIKKEYCCELKLSNRQETVFVTITGIKQLRIDIDSFRYCIQGKLLWGYSEFELSSDDNMKLAVLCDMQNEIQFEFERISLSTKRRFA